jgi:hypothetical protein
VRPDLFEEDDTPLGLIPPKDIERMKNETWMKLVRPTEEWIERYWDDALNAHIFFKADPL